MKAKKNTSKTEGDSKLKPSLAIKFKNSSKISNPKKSPDTRFKKLAPLTVTLISEVDTKKNILPVTKETLLAPIAPKKEYAWTSLCKKIANHQVGETLYLLDVGTNTFRTEMETEALDIARALRENLYKTISKNATFSDVMKNQTYMSKQKTIKNLQFAGKTNAFSLKRIVNALANGELERRRNNLSPSLEKITILGEILRDSIDSAFCDEKLKLAQVIAKLLSFPFRLRELIIDQTDCRRRDDAIGLNDVGCLIIKKALIDRELISLKHFPSDINNKENTSLVRFQLNLTHVEYCRLAYLELLAELAQRMSIIDIKLSEFKECDFHKQANKYMLKRIEVLENILKEVDAKVIKQNSGRNNEVEVFKFSPKKDKKEITVSSPSQIPSLASSTVNTLFSPSSATTPSSTSTSHSKTVVSDFKLG